MERIINATKSQWIFCTNKRAIVIKPTIRLQNIIIGIFLKRSAITPAHEPKIIPGSAYATGINPIIVGSTSHSNPTIVIIANISIKTPSISNE